MLPKSRRDFGNTFVPFIILAAAGAPCLAQDVAPLPDGVRAVWDIDRAHREKTPTRERVCLNGLWRWQPADGAEEAVPAGRWGHFKVPGFWPGTSNYAQEDCQTLHRHPAWKGQDIRSVTSAWYQREVAIPDGWAGRRIALSAEYVNSFAAVYVDGKKAGEIRFPAGQVDLTAVCRPGAKHVITLRVLALPLKGVMLSYSDTNAAREVKGAVSRRGLCGDLYLFSTPAGPRVAGVKIDTSVRRGEIAFDVALEGLEANASYLLRAEIREGDRVVKEITSRVSKPGRVTFSDTWKPDKLWDLHTPGNLLEARVSIAEAGGKVLDVAHSVRFGFREFWIDGRDFYLNGTRLHLSSVPLDNGNVGARVATYEGARESLQRLQGFGINFVYTHNYGCEPGSHVSFDQILKAADDVGMLVAFSQPHFSHYDWKAPDNAYARHAEFYVRSAQNHPSVVAYSMSHNATGYEEDMNPDMIDGIQDPRDSWSANNAKLALRAEAIVKGLDPGRIVYHHSSGNLGSMHTSNFYVNFTPIQELCDWFEHWAVKGVKPMFPVEYGVPFSWDWTMYRGWYKGAREWGSAKVPWEYCLAEWNAQFLGDRAFELTEMEKRNLRWEAAQFRAGNLWHRWDYPQPPGSAAFEQQQEVYAKYITDTWRAYRTWGLSANSPWEYHMFWKGASKGRRELKVDWENLQRPGFSPDFIDRRNTQMDLDLERSDWIPTAAAEALIRNNRPLLAWIAGKPERFTSKDHNFFPGERFEKQLIVINDSRRTVSCEAKGKSFDVPTGEQHRTPLGFDAPAGGTHELSVTVKFGNGETQKDSFAIHVLPRPAPLDLAAKVALFDPKGETGRRLAAMNVRFQQVEANADLSAFDILIVGKEALTPEGPGPDVLRVRDGLKVIVFEQTAKVLEERFGFRTAEYGLRQVYKRVPDHPLLAGLETEHLRDWRGEATILTPRLKYQMRPRYGPTIKWCGIDVTRAWRCGSRGNVASVLIEKPARGDFLPVVDGGYSLQYSPLLEYREGKGLVLFCQLDVTGRTESDPAAEILLHNIVRRVSTWKPAPARVALYAGDPAGKSHLEAAGFAVTSLEKGDLPQAGVLVLGPGCGKVEAIGRWIQAGGHVLAIGLDGTDMPLKVSMTRSEHISSYFESAGANSLLAGIGPADVHNRDPRELSLVAGGNGMVVKLEGSNVVFCPLAPWTFDARKQMNLKRTFRRSSCLLTRLLSNMGVAGATPVLSRFRAPVDASKPEKRWLKGLYLDEPEEWDDPYRFFRW